MEPGKLYVVYNKWIQNPDTHEMPYKSGRKKKKFIKKIGKMVNENKGL
jgi:hypothetical protein